MTRRGAGWALLLLLSATSCDGGGSAAPEPTASTVAATTVAPAATQAGTTPSKTEPPTTAPSATVAPEAPTYSDPAAPIEERVDDLLARMSLADKVGQMTMVDRAHITPEQVTESRVGAVLSGGGSVPTPNTPEAWTQMVDGYQEAALATPLAVPILYGIDAVHGNGNVYGATLFPHSIGLGAAGDPDLVEQVARATAVETAALGIRWDFFPMVAVPHDIRWGRTYESFSEDPELVARLGVAYIDGLQRGDGEVMAGKTDVLATAKHYIGDGAAVWGTSTSGDFTIDQGDTPIDEALLRSQYLPAYQAAVDAGVRTVMVSFSSWQGTKMHANQYLLTDVLKDEVGFDGIVLSDWAGIDQIPGDYASDVVTSVNAGMDMVMVPAEYPTFIADLTAAVEAGDVPMARIDDAVRRILRVKFESGVFEHPFADPALAGAIGSAEHRQLAAEAVRRSAVLLKNEGAVLPLDRGTPTILVAGQAADDVGLQAGGWTLTHQGAAGPIVPGSTIVEGIRGLVTSPSQVRFDAAGEFADLDASGGPVADVAIVVLAEPTYAEGTGDRADLTLPAEDLALLERVRPLAGRLVVVLLSGRPLVVTEQLPGWDGLVAAWLPGSEGAALADVLFGEAPFTGHLPVTWPRWTSQLPQDPGEVPGADCDGPLFPLGFGLAAGDTSPAQLSCPPA